jgi:tetratricopeptide (TPR) repeat protein
MLSLSRLANALGLVAGLLAAASVSAQTPPAPAEAPAAAPADEPVVNSAMDGQLFYQLLIGEVELRDGNLGTAYQVLLDGARRSGDDALFRRVINLALQARAGDEALQAARAWATTVPDSAEAQQTILHLVALLNRPGEATDALRTLLSLSTPEQRPAIILGLPRLFQRSPEPKRVLAALAPVLQGQMGPARNAALFVEARLAINAGENARALTLTRTLNGAMPDGDEPMQLALELLPVNGEAEPLILARLARTPEPPQLRIAYARALARAQRPGDAAREFRSLTRTQPENGAVWLALGALEVELREVLAADQSLREALKRFDQPAAAASDDDVRQRAGMRQQAWLLLAQIAEQRGDLKGAEAWLNKIEGAGLDVQYRRASLLARQGKLEEARQLLRASPQADDDDTRARALAESQLLREQRAWSESLAVLQAATARFADDPDLLYEQAMVAEKLGRFEDMETWLRRVMSLKPEHHHAYNALGYSLAERNTRLPEAKELIERALKLAPGEPFIVDSLGWVEFRLGNLDAAAKLLRQAYQARPDTEIAAHLGEVLWATGQRDDARKVWSEASSRDPKSEALRETLDRLKVGL